MAKTRYSRLSRRLESQSRKNLILSILGIIIVFILLIKFGIPLLVNFSLFISQTKSVSAPNKSNLTSFVNPPTLNPIPSATNSAKFTISGSSTPEQTIDLYVNDNLVDKTGTDKNGNFSFDITLNSGGNSIKTKAVKDDKKSDFSNILNIVYKNNPPSLEVTAPSDGQSFSKEQNTAKVTGKTDVGVKVTVNGFWAIIDENNNFSYTLPLQNGDNQIKIIATDEADNKTEKDIKVTYSP